MGRARCSRGLGDGVPSAASPLRGLFGEQRGALIAYEGGRSGKQVSDLAAFLAAERALSSMAIQSA